MAQEISLNEIELITSLSGNTNVMGEEGGAWKRLNLINAIYPVGSIYINVNEINPSILFGGLWERIKGKFLVGVDEDDSNYSSSNVTGGEKTHTLTVAEMPSHIHALMSEYGAAGTAEHPPKDNGDYIQAAGTSASSRLAVSSVITSTGGAEATTIYRLITQFIFGKELAKTKR